MYVQIAILLISLYMAYKMRPKPVQPVPEAFEDIEFPQVDEGTPQAVIFGDCWTGDWVVLAVGDYRTTPIRTKSGK